MAQEIFEARWLALQALRAQGHMELEDFMGRGEPIEALEEAGLLEVRDLADAWQRYGKRVPTRQGERYLIHDAAQHIIVVRRNQLGALSEALRNLRDLPSAPLNDQATAARVQRIEQQMQRTHDSWALVRLQELLRWVRKGYMDLEQFQEVHGIGTDELLDNWICERYERDGRNGHAQLVPLLEGMRFLKRVDAWDIVLLKPGMEPLLLEYCRKMRPQRRANG